MANKENKGKAETFILRGNAESVMRQLVDEYNSSNGWSVNRIVNNILNFTVVLERIVNKAYLIKIPLKTQIKK